MVVQCTYVNRDPVPAYVALTGADRQVHSLTLDGTSSRGAQRVSDEFKRPTESKHTTAPSPGGPDDGLPARRTEPTAGGDR